MNKEILKKLLEKILKSYGVSKAAIFGSYARGEQRENSDVDILVDTSNKMSLLDFVGLKLDIEDKLKKRVDLVQFKNIKQSIRRFIINDQIIFYQQ